MKRVLFFILLLVVPFLVHGEDLELKWEHNYGGSGYEWFNTLNYSYDENGNIDGYLVTGESESKDILGLENEEREYTGLFIKYDFNGRIIWQKAIDELYPNSYAKYLIYKYDKNNKVSGYVVLFTYYSDDQTYSNVDQRVVVVDFDLKGNIINQKVFSGIRDNMLEIYPYFENNIHKGYYITQRYKNPNSTSYLDELITDVSLYDLNLNYVRNVSNQIGKYHQFYMPYFYLLREDNGTALGYVAKVSVYGENDKLVKFNNEMEIEWEVEFEGHDSISAYMFLSKDKNNKIDGIIIDDFKKGIIKYDLNGQQVWSLKLTEDVIFGLDDIIVTYNKAGEPDGYLITSAAGSVNDVGNSDMKAVTNKVSLDGIIVWKKYFGTNQAYDGVYNRTGYDRHLLMSTDKNGKYDGYYVLVTESNSTDIPGITQDNSGNAVFLKYDFNGNIVWQYSYGGSKDDSLDLDGWDVGSNLCYSYDLNGNIDGVIFMMSDTSSNFGTIVNKGDYDPVLVKFGYHMPKMDISVTLDDKDIVLYEKERESTYKVLVKNIGNTDSDDNIIKTVIPQELEIIEDSISDSGTYDKDSRTITWTYGKLMMGDSKEFTFKVKTKDKLDKNIQFNSTLSSSITSNQESNEVKIIINPITKVGIGLLVIVLFIGSLIYIIVAGKKNKISI